jgi:hypothetical protein
MGHEVRLVVGRPEAIAAFQQQWTSARSVELLDGWVAAPVSDALYDEIQAAAKDGAARDEAFDMSPIGLEAALAEASQHGGALAYVETSYFGGTGSQSAGAWIDGRLREATRSRGVGAINRALSAIGVRDANGLDAFDTIGLGRKRSMDAYEQENEQQAPAALTASRAAGYPVWLVAGVVLAAIAFGVWVAGR